MRRKLLILATLVIAIVGSGVDVSSLAQPANPQEENSARQAAKEIVNALGSQKYKLLWDNMTSQWFKSRVGEDAFLANMSMGRAQWGVIRDSSLISVDHATTDPSGYQGDIYAFTFRDKYAVGEFFERIVVIKDPDGHFRMSGVFGSPVPQK